MRKGVNGLGDSLNVDNVEDVQYRGIGAGLRRRRGGEAPPRTLSGSLPKRSEGGPAGAETADPPSPAGEWHTVYPDVEGDAGPPAGGSPSAPAKPAGIGTISIHEEQEEEGLEAARSGRRRLLRLLSAKGSTLQAASIAMGRNDAYLQQFVHRGTPKILAEDDREILAGHLGCRPELLKHGRSYRLSTHARQPLPSGAYAAPRGYSVVPEADVRVEAGVEAWNGVLRETGEGWLFADSFIRHRLRADPGDLWMIEADADSMAPMLSTGDHFMIDVSRTVPAPPGIFVIWDGVALVAKRVEHVPHSEPTRLVLKPVNPEYRSHERAAEEVSVAGRAVWVSKRL